MFDLNFILTLQHCANFNYLVAAGSAVLFPVKKQKKHSVFFGLSIKTNMLLSHDFRSHS